MAVNGANIIKAQLFKDGDRGHHAFHIFFGASNKVGSLGHRAQNLLATLTDLGIKLTGPKL